MQTHCMLGEDFVKVLKWSSFIEERDEIYAGLHRVLQ